jgi:hypothetical protein
MQRVYRCFDLLQAHAIAASLRHDGIQAHVFDADFVRQDWFKMLAYGGFRIVVPNEDASRAAENIRLYQEGALSLHDVEGAACPNCGEHSGHDDPQPRRNVFIAMFVLAAAEIPVLLSAHPSAIGLLEASAVLIALGVTLPWLLIRYFKWRYRCSACNFRWRESRRHSWKELSRLAEAAESETGA